MIPCDIQQKLDRAEMDLVELRDKLETAEKQRNWLMNELQHQITAAWLRNFEAAIQELQKAADSGAPVMDPRMLQINLAALRSQATDLRAQLAAYREEHPGLYE